VLHYYHSFLPPYFHLWNIPFLFVTNLISESMGALVGGGSIVTLPVMLFIGAPLQAAIATDNAASLGTEAGILTETWQKVMANKRLVVIMMIPSLLGGIVGTRFLLTISATIIKYLMVAAVVLLLAYTYFSKSKPNPSHITKSHYVLLIIFLFLSGLYVNFIGLGAGTFARIGLMSVLGMSFIQSQGLKSASTMPTLMYSLIVTGIAGLILWPYLLTKWCANFIAGKYATRFVKKIPDVYLKAVLTILSIAFVIYLLFFY